jgi:hypothetical protein
MFQLDEGTKSDDETNEKKCGCGYPHHVEGDGQVLLRNTKLGSGPPDDQTNQRHDRSPPERVQKLRNPGRRRCYGLAPGLIPSGVGLAYLIYYRGDRKRLLSRLKVPFAT